MIPDGIREASTAADEGSDLSKERFAFASGNIFASGLLVLNLWPFVATYQTGAQIHFWSTNTPGEGVHAQIWVFWMLTLFLATGSAAVLLAGLHILGRGLWLGASSGPGRAPRSQALPRLAELTYGASFLLAALMLFWSALTPLVLLSAGLEQALVRHASLSLPVAGWISRSLLVVLLLVALGWASLRWVWRPLMRTGRLPLPFSGAFSLRSFVLAMVLLFVFWLTVIELCQTVDLRTDKQVASIAKGDEVRLDVLLGGSASDPAPARLSLRSRATGRSQPLAFQSLEQGRYVALVPVAGLAPGIYDAVLEYPHVALTATYPHIQFRQETRAFVVER